MSSIYNSIIDSFSSPHPGKACIFQRSFSYMKCLTNGSFIFQFFACSDTDKLYICLQIKNFISVFRKQSITVFPWMLKNPFQQMFERYTDFLFTETGWDPLNTVLIKTVFPKEEQQKKKHTNIVHGPIS